MNRILAIGLTLAVLTGLILFFRGATSDPKPKTYNSKASPKREAEVLLTQPIKLSKTQTASLGQDATGAEPKAVGEGPQEKGAAKDQQSKKRRWQRRRMRFLANRWVQGMEEFARDKNQSLIAAKLELLIVNLSLDAQLLEDVLEDLNRSGLGFEIRVDPRVLEYLKKNEVEVSLRLKSISLKDALTLILSVHPDLVYFIDNGILEITWKQLAPLSQRAQEAKLFERIPIDQLHADYRKVLRTRKVSLNFKNTPLSDVISFLQDISGLNITVSRTIDTEALLVNHEAQDTLENILKAILSKHKLHWIFENETLKVVDKASSDAFWQNLNKIETQQKTAQQHLNSKASRSLSGASLGQALSFLKSEFQVGTSNSASYSWNGALRVNQGDSLALICERMALLADGSWELRQQPSGQYAVYFWQAQPGLISYCQSLLDDANTGVSANILDNHRVAFEKLSDTATQSITQALQFKSDTLKLQSATQLRMKRNAFREQLQVLASHCLKAWLASNSDKTYQGLASDQDILQAYELRHRLGSGAKLESLLNDYIFWINQTTFEDPHPGLKLLGLGDD
ncbi:MAG: DUF4974 domain-containing protein [Planctomycetota bacterium]|nr:DUF4974 domain-containing protein [Planctomycetota bacterium]